jgi:acyl-CoA hydrolase
MLRHADLPVTAASEKIDFAAPARIGDENLMTGQRRQSATAVFTMVSVDEDGQPKLFNT